MGRGLSALLESINEGQQEPHATSTDNNTSPLVAIQEIDVKEITPNPYQPRTEFAEEKLNELADSIKLMGVIQPITVKKISDHKYQIISGERRFRASALAGRATIPAYIREADEGAMLEMAIVENIQREDLDPIDIALSFQRLIDECSLTQEALSQRVGKNRVTVANFLRLLRLPPEIQLIVKSGRLSMGHAKALLGLENESRQLEVANKIIEEGLSVRQVESLVQKINETPSSGHRKALEIKHLSKSESELEAILKRYFTAKVSVRPSGTSGAGSLSVRYNSPEELQKFLDKLK